MRVPALILDGRRRLAPAAGGPAPAVETWLDGAGQVFARCEAREGRYVIDLPGVACFAFGPAGGTVTATPAPATPPETVRAAYRHHALPLVLQALGLEALHASAVLTPAGVVGFCAPSGGGKSTLAVALSLRGHPLWADDALVLDCAADAVEAVRVPFEPRLRPAARAALGEAALRRACVGTAARPPRAPLARLCLLAPAAAGPPERLAPAAAFAALLPHAFCFTISDRPSTRRVAERYLAIAARVPVDVVPVEWGLGALPGLAERLAAALAAPTPAAG